VVECKDYGRPVSVDKVEAFVTKKKKVKASEAIMASTSGFQEGAQQVADENGIKLIHITESLELDPSVFGAQWGPEIDALSIKTIELEYADGEKLPIPEESNAMTYYVNHIVLRTAADKRTLDSVISELSTRFDRGKLDEYKENSVDCPADTYVTAPEDDIVPLKQLSRIHVRTGLVKAKTLTGPMKFEPSLLDSDVEVRNLSTGEVTTFKKSELELGFETAFEVGKFYEQRRFGNFYYCGKVDVKIATIYLVESFQNGQLFQAEFTQETQYAKFYLPVTDQKTIKRLRRRFDKMMAS
jgi:hypothetical protein